MEIDKRGSSGCFACGKDNPYGLKLDFTYDEKSGKAVCKFVIEDKYIGWEGAAHGGIIATLLDEGMVYAALGAKSALVATAKMDVKFKRPVPTEKEIILEGEVVEANRRVIVAKSRIVYQDKVLAECFGSLSIMTIADDIYSNDNFLAISRAK